jgi:hypothetical protein
MTVPTAIRTEHTSSGDLAVAPPHHHAAVACVMLAAPVGLGCEAKLQNKWPSPWALSPHVAGLDGAGVGGIACATRASPRLTGTPVDRLGPLGRTAAPDRADGPPARQSLLATRHRAVRPNARFDP